ncbi:MAG: hypothetical protein ISF22_01645 [Methanomassiliicoccus sp.]|nr:hypothetical protein [Methanomassiliicoccus sp.]
MIGKLEIIGEWAADGSLEESDERRIVNVRELNEAIKQRVYELDLQVLLAGLLTILGIHQEGGEKRYSLEVHVPLFLDEGSEYDVTMLERRATALKVLKDRGYYLEGHRGGFVKCFREGSLNELDEELDFIERAVAEAG